MKRGIANWELSGTGDGAYDRTDDDDKAEEDEGCSQEGHEKFGSMIGRNRTRLSNRHSFFEYNSVCSLCVAHAREAWSFKILLSNVEWQAVLRRWCWGCTLLYL